jgi:hypothetical protein
MIGVIFQLGNEIVETRIDGTNLAIRSSNFGSQFMTVDSLYFSKEGVIKEFPDLENEEYWRQIAIERFKLKLKRLGNESAIADYLIEDLKKHGYIPKARQKSGFRVEVLDGI